ncbi:MAG: FAD-dependent oxidoreductase [Acidobacteria bacterium]|nr:FAD-dependent oxidoreductase [Acidobacteriota bacterium]
MSRSSSQYNAVVMGSGPGGLVAAAGLAGLGARVALVERDRMGGDCLNTGCVPSKALIASARVAHLQRHADRFGLTPQNGGVDVGRVFERMRRRRAHLAHHDSPERFESLGVHVYHGAPGVFLSPEVVQVGNETLHADRFVIATGARAVVPTIPGLKETPHYTNENFFDDLTGAPPSLAIMGGGPIGAEMAQAMSRLGVPTTIIEMGPHLLAREDPDAIEVVNAALAADGVEILTGHTAKEVVPGPVSLGPRSVRVTIEQQATGKMLQREFGALLVAVGRAPNVQGLGLDAAGVAHDPRHGIKVEATLQTSRKHIFAIGDVASPYKFTHVADAQARTVIRNILIPFKPVKFATRVIPWCTYTDPECAHVGHNETSARQAGLDFTIHKFELGDLDRAVLEDAAEGFVKVLADRRGRILGATVVGAGAGDWIHEYVTAMKHGISLPDLSGMIHAYPTFGEASRRPADAFMRARLTPMARRILGWRWGRPRPARSSPSDQAA